MSARSRTLIERRLTNRLELGLPRDRRQHARVGHLLRAARSPAGRRTRAATSSQSAPAILRVVEHVDGGQAVRFVDALERIERDVAQHRQRVVAHAASASSRAMAASAGGSISLATAARRTRDVVVFACRGDDQIALGERQLRDIGQPNRRIGMLLGGCVRNRSSSVMRLRAPIIGRRRRGRATPLDLLVDVENAAVETDVERPARREAARAQHAVRAGGVRGVVTQNRIRETERARKLCVGGGRVHTRRKATARCTRTAPRPPQAIDTRRCNRR